MVARASETQRAEASTACPPAGRVRRCCHQHPLPSEAVNLSTDVLDCGGSYGCKPSRFGYVRCAPYSCPAYKVERFTASQNCTGAVSTHAAQALYNAPAWHDR